MRRNVRWYLQGNINDIENQAMVRSTVIAAFLPSASFSDPCRFGMRAGMKF